MSKRARKAVSQEFIDDSDDPEDAGVNYPIPILLCCYHDCTIAQLSSSS